MFRKSLDLSVLTERRVLAPYGMAGGHPGLKGQNTLVNFIKGIKHVGKLY